jgi:hypothetical protein
MVHTLGGVMCCTQGRSVKPKKIQRLKRYGSCSGGALERNVISYQLLIRGELQ